MLREQRGQLVRKALAVTQARLGLRGCPEKRVPPVRQGLKGPLELRGSRAHQEKLERQVPQALLGREEIQVQPAPLGFRGRKEKSAPQDLQAQQE